MNKCLKSFTSLLIVFSLLLSLTVFSFADTISVKDISEPQTPYENDNISSRASSTDDPFVAYLVIATNSYAAPNPSTGHINETVAANTTVWIAEKVYCSYNNRYYYYCGYAYNGQSHRGYFCEDNVYYNGSKLSHSNITAESKPANMKVLTSLAGTVYDGPGTSYAVAGSVGQESIKLIRTDEDYNFIEYTVTSTGKIKRGYLDYTKITGPWGNLTAQTASALNGKTFYLKNSQSGQYLDVISWQTTSGTRLQHYSFSGDTNQMFKFNYDSSGKFYYIQPVHCYNANNRRLSIKSTVGTPRADRHLIIDDPYNVYNQKFWVVAQTDVTNGYKIVPLSSYGTMTLTNRSNYINQYYTNTGSGATSDTWVIEPTEKSASVSFYTQDTPRWCWVASAKCIASVHNQHIDEITQFDAAMYVKPNSSNLQNETGTILETAMAANYFVNQNIDSDSFKGDEYKIYSEKDVRRIVNGNNALSLAMINFDISIGHAISLYKFKWVDKQGTNLSPGYYEYYCYDPWDEGEIFQIKYIDLTINGTNLGTSNTYKWINTAVYDNAASANPINCN